MVSPKLSHHDGPCSFVALLRKNKLSDPVLDRIGRIVDEADTIQEVQLEPAAAGMDLICEGLRRTSPDDLSALDRGGMVYEAFTRSSLPT